MDYGWLSDRAANIYSQGGEDGVIRAIFDRIGEENRVCFECGASNGIYFSNTRALMDAGWRGILVESDQHEYARLVSNSAIYPGRAQCVHTTIDGTRTIDAVLAECNAPNNIDLVVIDVDGQDYYLFNSIYRFRPRVIMCEYDPFADINHIPFRGGPGQSGALAISKLAQGKMYVPIYRSQFNMIFVTQPINELLKRAPA